MGRVCRGRGAAHTCLTPAFTPVYLIGKWRANLHPRVRAPPGRPPVWAGRGKLLSGKGFGVSGREKAQTADTGRRSRRLSTGLWRLLGLLVVLAVSLFIYSWADQFERFRAYGYVGLFLISLLANASLLLPAPSLAVVFAMGGALNPWLVGLVAGVGEALGELTGYLAGYSSRAVIENRALYARLDRYMDRYGLGIVFLLSVFPNPFFDLAGIAAGALRCPLWQFLLVCWLGKTVKTVIFALAGAQSISLFQRFM